MVYLYKGCDIYQLYCGYYRGKMFKNHFSNQKTFCHSKLVALQPKIIFKVVNDYTALKNNGTVTRQVQKLPRAAKFMDAGVYPYFRGLQVSKGQRLQILMATRFLCLVLTPIQVFQTIHV